MNAISKVDGNGAHGQVNNIPARCKDEDLIRKNIHLHRVDKITGIIHIIMPFQQLTQPAQLSIKALIRACGRLAAATFLITPMGSDTIFTDAMHLKGADLDFQGLTTGTQNRSMQ